MVEKKCHSLKEVLCFQISINLYGVCFFDAVYLYLLHTSLTRPMDIYNQKLSFLNFEFYRFHDIFHIYFAYIELVTECLNNLPCTFFCLKLFFGLVRGLCLGSSFMGKISIYSQLSKLNIHEILCLGLLWANYLYVESQFSIFLKLFTV